MDFGQDPGVTYYGAMMIIGAAVAFYVASRAAADAVSVYAFTGLSTLRHALAQWLSIVWVALVAVVLGHPEIAIGVIFSTAVAVLSLHLGIAVLSGEEPAQRRAGSPAAVSRTGAFVLPTAVLALVVGFAGRLTLLHAVLLAAQGALIASVWKGRADDAGRAESRGPLPAPRKLQLALAVILGGVGAVAAVYGAVRMSNETAIMSTGLIASAALGPLLVLPMIGSASALAAHGQVHTAAGASVLIALLNLCLLLPTVTVGWHLRQVVAPQATRHVIESEPSSPASTTGPSTTGSATQPSADDLADDPVEANATPEVESAPVLTFPMAVWRIDTVLLILLGLFLLPVSLGLWGIRRSEGAVLIVVYATYIIATTILGRRWG